MTIYLIAECLGRTKSRSNIRKSGRATCPALRLLFVTVAVLCCLYSVAGQPRPADLVIVNANIRTITTRDSKAAALAVTANRITAVGADAEVRKLIGPSTRIIDAAGRLVLPGFNDAHVHFTGIGNTFSSIDLRDAKRAEDVITRVERYARFLPRGRWILGSGLPTGPPVSRKGLDVVSSANPVFIYNAGASSALANSLAFTRAGLKDDMPGVDRDASGVPTGTVRSEAMRRIAGVVPQDQPRNWPEIAETATNYAASLGVTSVQDMHSDDSRAVYVELHKKRKLKTRVYDCLALHDWKKLSDSRLANASGDMVRDGCVKSFSDGDPNDVSSLRRQIAEADKVGLQVMVHAIGKSANGIVLTVFEEVAKLNRARDRRLRVEHAHGPNESDLPRFARSQSIASMQPHLFEYGNGEYYETLLLQNTVLAFGSDAAMVDLNPLLGIHAAVNAPTESISVYDAVRAYTLGSAFAEFQEKEKGTIEPGKLADFVILSDDIFIVERSRIKEAKVVRTFVDGREVFALSEK